MFIDNCVCFSFHHHDEIWVVEEGVFWASVTAKSTNHLNLRSCLTVFLLLTECPVVWLVIHCFVDL